MYDIQTACLLACKKKERHFLQATCCFSKACICHSQLWFPRISSSSSSRAGHVCVVNSRRTCQSNGPAALGSWASANTRTLLAVYSGITPTLRFSLSLDFQSKGLWETLRSADSPFTPGPACFYGELNVSRRHPLAQLGSCQNKHGMKSQMMWTMEWLSIEWHYSVGRVGLFLETLGIWVSIGKGYGCFEGQLRINLCIRVNIVCYVLNRSITPLANLKW